MEDEYNATAHQNTIDQANANSNAAYQQGMLEFQNQQLAFQKAQQAWRETMDRAGLTGMYEGQWTLGAQMGFANAFGQWGAPTQGQQTLAGMGQQAQYTGQYGTGGPETLQSRQQTAQNLGTYDGQQTLAAQQQVAQNLGTFQGQQTLASQAQEGNMFGNVGGRETLASQLQAANMLGTYQGQQTQAAQQQAWAQAFAQQQEANRQQQLGQTNAQSYLQMLSQLRGPADWAKYQEVLGATPGGMRDLYAAAMGQYIPGGGATTGMQPQAANLTTMMQQVAGQPVTWTGQGSQAQGQLTNPMQNWQPPSGTPGAQANQYQQQWDDGAGATMRQLQGGLNTQLQQEQQRAQQAYQQQAQGGGTNMMGANQPQQGQPGLGQAPQGQQNLPAPNQIAPQAWKNMAPSQQQMLLGQYESQGWHKPDVEALFNQSLPKYAANAPSAGTFKLR